MTRTGDPLFDMFVTRALGLVTRGGAETGEVEAAVERVRPGDTDSWYAAWAGIAELVAAEGEASLVRGHRRSAAEAFWRATTYFRTSYQPLFGKPVDPRLTAAFARERECFSRMARLSAPPVVTVEVPYEDTVLPGYLCLADDGNGAPRATLVSVNGYDSNIHEMYWAHAIPAVRRGYVSLLVDGPGQGQPLVEQGLSLRPDWEAVLSRVLDFACTRPEVDPERLAVTGWSLGGFLAPRGVAGDARVKALIADPGQWDMMAHFPKELTERVADGDTAELGAFLEPLATSPVGRWKFVQRALWVHGVDGLGELVLDMARYRVSDVVDRITCPSLVVANENDPVSEQALRLHDELPGPKTLLRLPRGQGYDSHCQTTNRSGYDRLAFDWLDDVVKP
ncbi:alpha/beta hydrolase family protein [Yinghuangia seranimata]|uniref:alpha/beta hydrolase family protein n=1 Tax=Yinghuangia seranimata TaxID=408067 RepID=UPI00248B1BF6|nr:alpha/beta hydrolase [Yinghuangia seranimata]MDI2129022.1 prolyl oligopeptidase family serine peptidase [Yinghuangia seranimata]